LCGANTNGYYTNDLPAAILIRKISYEENGRVVRDKMKYEYGLFLKDLEQDPHFTFTYE